ncbi:MAG TPA: YfjI family protein [Verrucomicrobiales bacterium]|nr:YfjI family protein [Verrucomicrobiales bacterium]
MNIELYDPEITHPAACQRALEKLHAESPEAPEDDLPPPEPRPLPCGLTPVLPVTAGMLPDAFRPWLMDITDRIRCPLEFPAVAALAAAGSVLGRKLGIHPKGCDDWYEYGNLWALMIGRPSMMKSPAMTEALRPLRALEAAADEAHAAALRHSRDAAALARLQREVSLMEARKALRRGNAPDMTALHESGDGAPVLRRYTATDTSPESLVELLRQNPNGLLLVADEMSGLLQLLDRPGNEALRSLYLTGWSGKGGYQLDRVGRGMCMGAPHVCLGLLGGIQPDVLRRHLFNTDNGAVDDGFTQRFQLAVWPDDTAGWRFIDRWPDSAARQTAHDVFQRLDSLDAAQLAGGEGDAAEGVPPCLRFDREARLAFMDWSEENHETARAAGATCPAMEAACGKYPKLVAGLALLFHLIDQGTASVGLPALQRAIAWVRVLTTHARRIFDAGDAQTILTARSILSRVKDGSLPSAFTSRQVYRPQWSGLKNRQSVEAALAVLESHGWVTVSVTGPAGGAAMEMYTIHPLAFNSVTINGE